MLRIFDKFIWVVDIGKKNLTLFFDIGPKIGYPRQLKSKVINKIYLINI